MKSQYTFLSLYKGEHYKTKRNFALYFILGFPLFITLCVLAYILYKSSDGVAMPFNPWTTILARYIFGFYSFYPLITSILCYSLCDMEYKNDSFKQLFTLPFSKKSIFGAKVLYLAEIVFLSSFISFASYLASGYFLSYAIPEMNFQNYEILATASIVFTKIFICLLAIGLIQYCLSLLFKSFVVPVGIACFMTIFSAVLYTNWKFDFLVPYCSLYNAQIGLFKGVTEFNKYDIAGIAYVPVLLIIGYFIMKKRSVNTK